MLGLNLDEVQERCLPRGPMLRDHFIQWTSSHSRADKFRKLILRLEMKVVVATKHLETQHRKQEDAGFCVSLVYRATRFCECKGKEPSGPIYTL